jgi:4-phytase/acid phosphatase
MIRFTRLLAAIAVLAFLAAPAVAATLKLERVVLVQRHGVRPPTSSNAVLAKYSAEAWPDWPVPPGELTPHGGATVELMGKSLHRTYRAAGLLPARGCPGAALTVWADGSDQRTRASGQITADALAPGCDVKAGYAPPDPRDPIFGGSSEVACAQDPAAGRAAILDIAGPAGLDNEASRLALLRLQAILAPDACKGGKGLCLSGDNTVIDSAYGPRGQGPMYIGASLAEDLLLEYAEGMPASEVGWGRAGTAEAIAAIMPVHERMFGFIRHNAYLGGRMGAPMAHVVLQAMTGATRPPTGEAPFGPDTKVVVLSGHDTNIALMGAVFGLDWTLPGQPDVTSPAETLAFELWRDPASGKGYVKAVVYYETLDQLRNLTPADAQHVDLSFANCADSQDGGCSVDELSRKVEALIPAGCGLI